MTKCEHVKINSVATTNCNRTTQLTSCVLTNDSLSINNRAGTHCVLVLNEDNAMPKVVRFDNPEKLTETTFLRFKYGACGTYPVYEYTDLIFYIHDEQLYCIKGKEEVVKAHVVYDHKHNGFKAIEESGAPLAVPGTYAYTQIGETNIRVLGEAFVNKPEFMAKPTGLVINPDHSVSVLFTSTLVSLTAKHDVYTGRFELDSEDLSPKNLFTSEILEVFNVSPYGDLI